MGSLAHAGDLRNTNTDIDYEIDTDTDTDANYTIYLGKGSKKNRLKKCVF